MIRIENPEFIAVYFLKTEDSLHEVYIMIHYMMGYPEVYVFQ